MLTSGSNIGMLQPVDTQQPADTQMTAIYLTSWEALSMKPNKKKTKLTFLHHREPMWTFPTAFSLLCRLGEDFWLPHHHVDFSTGPLSACISLKDCYIELWRVE